MRTASIVDLPVVRSSERMDYKRCKKRWYWRWRKGYVPRNKTFGALELGTWMHAALAAWYLAGKRRNGQLAELLEAAALVDIRIAESNKAPDYVIEKAEELLALGIEMARAYQVHYGNDKKISVVVAEIPLEFTISRLDDSGMVVAVHKIKPDLVFIDEHGFVWLMEHKTAKSIQLGHLPIDDQARPYGVMAEPALRKLGIINQHQQFRGIMYNFLRKALPDLRPTNAKGQYLNQNGEISKRQPPPLFVRKPVTLTKKAKKITLERLRDETLEITEKTLEIRQGTLDPDRLPKTPHKSCEKTCPFFDMCVAEENGINIRDMERMLFVQRDPYLYEEETTEDTLSFEIG